MSGILLASVGNSYGSAPVNTVAPAVTGTATVGQTLSTTNGTWLGAPAPTFTYQWQRTGVDIGGATSSTYVLVAADYANTIRCVVRATNSVAPAGVTANSNSTASVAGNAPVNTVAPAVTGTAQARQTLTTTNGTWTGVPTPTFTYQWQFGTTNISGATSSTYVVSSTYVGQTIRCVVTATNAVSAASANSNSTAAIAANVPAAPTIGTAANAGPTELTVTYTAPADNGGATITGYTATSSPGGITGTVSQSGSGTITVSGLSTGTAYTFTVTATNSVGTSAASSSSNSATPAVVVGQIAYTTPGTYTFVVPSGVTKVSILAVGAGGNGKSRNCCNYNGTAGAGGGLVYSNNLTVTPGDSVSIKVGSPMTCSVAYCCRTNAASTSYYGYVSNTQAIVFAPGGRQGGRTCGCSASTAPTTRNIGGDGPGTNACCAYAGPGGGGAAGYANQGGGGGLSWSTGTGGNSTTFNGYGGGGGAGGRFSNGSGCVTYAGGGGGGVGLLGGNSTGGTGGATFSSGGVGGSGGSTGGCGGTTTGAAGGTGGTYGGGGGGGSSRTSGAYVSGTGGGGAIRIIWPGNTRSFPSTCTGNL